MHSPAFSHISRRIVMALLLLFTCIGASAQKEATCDMKLYSSRSSSSSVKGTIKKGTKVSVSNSYPDGWCYVSAGGHTGYVYRPCLAFPKKEKPIASTTTSKGKSTTTKGKTTSSADKTTSSAGKSSTSAGKSNSNYIASPSRSNTSKSANRPKITASRTNLDAQGIYKRCNPAVFTIYNFIDVENLSVSQGSGFFVGYDGVAVTNYHIFEDGTELPLIRVADDDEPYTISEIIEINEELDYIVFRVDYDNRTYLPLAAGNPDIGEQVFAIGSPLNFTNTINTGIVSKSYGSVIQTSVPIDHGSSGGALINQRGEVIGITTGTLSEGSSANINYAISVNAFRSDVPGYWK